MYAESWVRLELQSARPVGAVSPSWFVGTVDVACISADSSVASTLVIASGLHWCCHSFHNTSSAQTCPPCVGLGSDTPANSCSRHSLCWLAV